MVAPWPAWLRPARCGSAWGRLLRSWLRRPRHALSGLASGRYWRLAWLSLRLAPWDHPWTRVGPWLARDRLMLLAFALVGGSGSHFDWEAFPITPETLRARTQDLAFIQRLIRVTLTCSHCHQRRPIESGGVAGVSYCQCPHQRGPVYGQTASPDLPWTPFLERPDILVWRMEQPAGSGLYAYKMYGRFDNVTADELVEVQLDMSDFRLSWDRNTAQCHVVDERVDRQRQLLAQVYYWEVNWPSFFANRDYVAQRRTQIFPDVNMAVILSRSVPHAHYPPKAKAHRVQDYESVLAIRPLHGAFDRAGVEFSLTAYENPGVSLPGSITTWVAIRGLPDYMNNLREACLKLRAKKAQSPGPSPGPLAL